MLTVTEASSARLAQVPDQKGLPDEVAIRFASEGQDIALQRDGERAGDTTFQHEGRTVLLLDVQVSELLAEDALDREGAKLKLQTSKESK